jgi:hypothetical protein
VLSSGVLVLLVGADLPRRHIRWMWVPALTSAAIALYLMFSMSANR